MKRVIGIVCSLLTFVSCSKSGGNEPLVPQPTTLGAAVLELPAQNEACANSVVISSTQSTVRLKWTAAKSAESYEVSIKNLDKGAIITQVTNATETSVTLERNTPYSWFVTAKAAALADVKSDVWKFYNPGPGATSYAPFTAEAVNPAQGQNVKAAGGKVNLNWAGADADNDIVGYDVWFGTDISNMNTLKVDVSDMFLNDVNVTSGQSYYWKVITKDSKGNRSDSGAFMFKVN